MRKGIHILYIVVDDENDKERRPSQELVSDFEATTGTRVSKRPV